MKWELCIFALITATTLGDVSLASEASAAANATRNSSTCQMPDVPGYADESLAKQEALLATVGGRALAIDKLNKAVEAAKLAKNSARIAITEGTLGNAYAKANRFDEGEQHLQRSIDLSRDLAFCRMAATSEINLGNVYYARGRISEAGNLPAEADNFYNRAHGIYDQAETDAKRSGIQALIDLAVINKARVMVRAGISDAFLDALSSVVYPENEQIAGRPRLLDFITVGHLITEALAYVEQGPIKERARDLAKRAFDLAASRARAARDAHTESLALGYLGEFLERESDFAGAETMTSRALFVAQRMHASDLLYRWDWQLGRLLAGQGDLDGAEAGMRRALKEVESIRADIPVDYINGSSSFLETTGQLYRQFANVLLLNADRHPDNARQLRIEAQSTLETMKVGELYNYFHDLCFDPTIVRKIEDISDRTVVLYPVLLPDRLEVLVFFPHGSQDPEAFVADVDQATVVDAAQALRRLLQSGDGQYVKPASQLYDWIFAKPLLSTLERNNVDTLVWIPDGALRDIPLAALTPNGTDFVIDHYAVATAPGLTLVDPKPISAVSRRATLLIGVSIEVPGSGFPALPNVSNEIREINAVHPGKVLLDKEFGVGTLRRELGAVPYGIVHVTTHAKFDHDKSYILTSEGPLTMDALEAAVKQSHQGDGSLELVFLEGCETAAGDDRAALGLAGIAIKAGAQSAVATLWPIYENPTSKLVVDFYRRISGGKGLSKAQALRAAQRALKSDPNFSHPYYWAPYLLIGNWL